MGKRLKRNYLKIPYVDENLTIELRVYHEINKIIKMKYKKGLDAKCSFAKKYSFTTRQVKLAVKCIVNPFYNNIEEDVHDIYQHIKMISIENIKKIIDKFICEIDGNYDILFQKFDTWVDYVKNIWERIKQGLDYMVRYPNSANKINHLQDEVSFYVSGILGSDSK